ncbi:MULTISPECIES: glycosyltransferase family 61 protein [Agrobacterium]|uniref:glycosyltransferase family 61 protein n=1 Tax=Agrobacterium TaxID=357 RepID=UPI001E576263|nr:MULTISPECIES: glycosyltransferase family 61 protein [Agrobacterium]UHS58226.1 glycosyltransferase family 61 protein [Agrobacterium vaccinii]
MLFDSALSLAKDITALTSATVALRTHPVNLDAADRYLFEPALRKELEPSQLLELENITTLANGWIYQRLTLVKDSFVVTRQPSISRQLRMLPKRAFAGLSAERIDKGVWITDNWSRNYYHWLTDAIPRLHLAKQRDPEIHLILPSYYHSIKSIKESLEPFMLKSIKIIPENGAAVFSNFHFPTYSAESGNYNESVIRSVGKIYRDHYGSSVSAGRRIYVSRSKASVRNVVNETEIAPVLARYGFEIVHCENMSFSEQVHLFSESSMIAGPHGAGLVNMMFMSPGAKILEIHPRDTRINNCYFCMASAFDHPYRYMLSKTASEALPSHLDNIIVDPKELDEQLSKMCVV